jgi:hypothetical protein
MPTIDLQTIITQLTGHASAGGLVGGIAATALGAIATNALGAAATSGSVQAALNPLGLSLPGLTPKTVPAPAPTAPAPAISPAQSTITAAAFATLPTAVQSSLIAAGVHIV